MDNFISKVVLAAPTVDNMGATFVLGGTDGIIPLNGSAGVALTIVFSNTSHAVGKLYFETSNDDTNYVARTLDDGSTYKAIVDTVSWTEEFDLGVMRSKTFRVRYVRTSGDGRIGPVTASIRNF